MQSSFQRRELGRALWRRADLVEQASLAVWGTELYAELWEEARGLYQQARGLGFPDTGKPLPTEEQALGLLPHHWFAG